MNLVKDLKKNYNIFYYFLSKNVLSEVMTYLYIYYNYDLMYHNKTPQISHQFTAHFHKYRPQK